MYAPYCLQCSSRHFFQFPVRRLRVEILEVVEKFVGFVFSELSIKRVLLQYSCTGARSLKIFCKQYLNGNTGHNFRNQR